VAIGEIDAGNSPFRIGRQGAVVAAALAGAGLLILAGAAAGGMRHALIVPVGFFAGLALYHAAFGFTGSWRRFLTDRRGVGLRAQIVMLAATCAVFFPLLDPRLSGDLGLGGFVQPTGLALALGAFLFGIGMQLGGGCGSGTLYAVGGGSTRMAVTLAAFVAGSVVATATFEEWSVWPAAPAVSLVHSLGAPAALALCLSLFALVFAASRIIERRRHGDIEGFGTAGRLFAGPWPLLAGALALAAVNIATLLVSGRPWGITWAFALWGAKLMDAAGVDVESWTYWRGSSAIRDSLLADPTSVMDLALMLGALAAAGLARRFAPQARIPLRSFAAALIGGLLMGYGARLATGCNIGAFFSGVASGSLHGFAWILLAVPGNAVGVRLRPWFGL
jgi:uncharacterized membrane protein YedE/YeeE